MRPSGGAHIDVLQCGMLVAGFTSITNHALAVTYLVQAGGRDAWLAGPIAMPAALLAVCALVALSRGFPGQSLAQYLPRVLGPGLGHALALVYVAYFLAGAIFTLRRTTDWLVDSVLPETPAWIITAVYLAACVYAAAAGIEPLARINQFTLPLLTALGISVSLLTMPNKDYGLLLPILERGPGAALESAWLAGGILGELCVLGMFAQYVRPGQRGLRLAVSLGVLFAVVTMTGPVSGSIAALGHRMSAGMPYPTFQQWLLVSFARFLERTDLLAVHQWLVGAYARMGLLLFAAALASWHVLRWGRWTWFLLGGSVLAGVGSQALFHNILAFDAFVRAVYLPAGAVLGLLMPPLLWAVAAARGLLAQGGGQVGARGRG